MTGYGKAITATGLSFTILLLTACLGGASTIRVKGNIETAADLNPDATGRPSPVVVRVYQLRAPGAFQSADFFSLYEKEAATLGQNLIAREDLELQPGSSQPYDKELDPATKYLGVIAAFRDIENAGWRFLQPLPDSKKVQLQIRLDSLKVSVATE